ncbi:MULTISPECIES: hypothetical protein [unclassified Rhodococcus (in: high G+C Gram-positive bacteria)]|uniref:hypothetical protein n=1 Tax=unclassified Rhodococcus (in: high G+C Gram-positive bacteria) TaxID=192944 RepID=UPI000B9B7F65|nr:MULTISPECIES: hypothetical protein [unclassified Rhodococcus (in: high G+C Gram-positive bacteria)]KAA0923154.1 hypothetical protein FQ188_18805 [Rhodococcus sp. ANT_H53B]MCJ0895135.1 alanine and proline-rich secreted protein Apa [Rhodococcus sp. ARC_M5]MCJ0979375.1 alanine and proline-rich secreted protein Apa [Rhodococcus sp. ARC_M12]MDI9927675.1 hypothetical protein [Rhodococcus sp. IEGM 1341]OZD57437.1 hypothetical protein CH268_20365 [Rhodococcus sp. 06-1460-1B]
MNSSTEALESSATPGRNKTAKILFAVVTVIAVAALAAAVFFGYGWGNALLSQKPTADTRDSALTGAQQAAVNLNTVDAANIDQSFDNMKSSITGDLMLNDLEQTRSGITDQVRQSGAKSDAEVLHGTLTELSTDENTATALVVIATTTTWPDRIERSKLTMSLAMEEIDGVWKTNKVDPIGSRISLDNPSTNPVIPNEPGGPADPNAADPNAADPGTDATPAPEPDSGGN